MIWDENYWKIDDWKLKLCVEHHGNNSDIVVLWTLNTDHCIDLDICNNSVSANFSGNVTCQTTSCWLTNDQVTILPGKVQSADQQYNYSQKMKEKINQLHTLNMTWQHSNASHLSINFLRYPLSCVREAVKKNHNILWHRVKRWVGSSFKT